MREQTSRRWRASFMSPPSASTAPFWMPRAPAINDKRLDFPTLSGPTMPVMQPAGTSRLTESSAIFRHSAASLPAPGRMGLRRPAYLGDRSFRQSDLKIAWPNGARLQWDVSHSSRPVLTCRRCRSNEDSILAFRRTSVLTLLCGFDCFRRELGRRRKRFRRGSHNAAPHPERDGLLSRV